LNSKLDLDNVVRLFKDELSESLTGIYLHGSMAMGCFNKAQSDIDLLIIVNVKHSVETYKRIATKLLQIEEDMKILKGLELSVVLESNVVDFVYPTPFEFHYSAHHKEKYKNNVNYFCGGFNDPDLAAHFVVTYNRGAVLYGKPIKEVFNPIDKQYFIQSIMSDIEDASEGIIGNPVYYVLNLTRALLYLRDSVVASKREGGEWAINVLPTEYVELIQQCLAKYNSEVESIAIEDQILIDFSNYMQNEIKRSK